jgi:hypothetical protein
MTFVQFDRRIISVQGSNLFLIFVPEVFDFALGILCHLILSKR